MFRINTKEKSKAINLKPDYYDSIYRINCYLNNEIKTIVTSYISCYTYDINLIIESTTSQAIKKLKNDYLSFVLVHEYEIAKLAGVIDGKNDREKFLSYIYLTDNNDWLDYLFNKYTKLKDRIEKYIFNFIKFFRYFIINLKNDLGKIKKKFIFDEKIKEINLFLGDFHSGNKYVIKIGFCGNKNLYFKPRKCSNGIFLKNTILKLNTLGAKMECVIPKTYSTDTYSWVEELTLNNRFNSMNSVSNFYYNQGKFLFLFNFLGTTDIIPDNIIITNNLPGYFDLESIVTMPKYKIKGTIRYEFEESVVKTGMLPVWMINNNFERDILSSSFFKFNTQKVSTKIWSLKNDFVFEYRNTIQNFSFKDDQHLPKLNNQYIQLNEELLDKVEEGYTFLHNLVQTNKKELSFFFKSQVNTISNRQRVILHPTSVYSLFIREVCIPEYLEGKLNIKKIIKTLVKISETDNYKINENRLIKSIEEQLEIMDIPYFYVDLKKGYLYDGNDKILSKDWNFNAYEYISYKLNSLNKNNLKFQLEIIRKTCEFAFEHYQVKYNKEEKLNFRKNYFTDKINNIKVDKNKYLDTAISIGEEILNKSFIFDNTINWVSKVRDPTDGRYHISLLNYDLYDGLSGMVILYLYLYKYSKKEAFKLVALKIYDLLNDLIINRFRNKFYSKLDKGSLDFYPISPYAFPSSFLFLSTHIKTVVGEKYIQVNTLETSLKEIEKIISTNKNFDYLLGHAGLIDFLINFMSEFQEKSVNSLANKILNKSMRYLILNAQNKNKNIWWNFIEDGNFKELGGFAHGSAGIAYSLFKTSIEMNKNYVYDYAIGALNHDRFFYNKNIQGWFDNRNENDSSDSAAWCHGSSGIALSRLLISKYHKDDLLEKELKIAKKNIITRGLQGNQCVCHGDLGNMEILMAVNNYLNDNKSNNNIYNYLNKLCDSFDKGLKFNYGDGGRMELLGLFMGFSGIAYQMLRFYNWENTPSILCLETPKKLNNELH